MLGAMYVAAGDQVMQADGIYWLPAVNLGLWRKQELHRICKQT